MTTYYMTVEENLVAIARTSMDGESVKVEWLNPLATFLCDDEPLKSDAETSFTFLVGDLRELEVPSDAEVIVKLREELAEAKEAKSKLCKHLSDALEDTLDRETKLLKEVRKLNDEIHGLLVGNDDLANESMSYEED